MFRRVGRCVGIPFTLVSISRPPVLAQDSQQTSSRSFWYKRFVSPSNNVFGFHEDTYGGVVFDFDAKKTISVSDFKQLMSNSLEYITSQGYCKGLWLKIPISHSHLIPSCTADFSFDFHHAERGYVTLCKWMHPSKADSLPGSATHTVGIGAVCLSPDNRVLLVKEQTGPAAMLKVWKLPTGRVEAGEDLSDAALREVKEETGLSAKFEGVLFVRHGLRGAPYLGEKSDLFFVCVLRVDDPSQLNLQADEIADAKWVKADELLASTNFQPGTSGYATMEAALDAAMTSPKLLQGARYASWRPGDFLTHFKL